MSVRMALSYNNGLKRFKWFTVSISISLLNDRFMLEWGEIKLVNFFSNKEWAKIMQPTKCFKMYEMKQTLI